jgi:hypothetical protein
VKGDTTDLHVVESGWMVVTNAGINWTVRCLQLHSQFFLSLTTEGFYFSVNLHSPSHSRLVCKPGVELQLGLLLGQFPEDSI